MSGGTTVAAADIKVGDRITLDMGYGAHTNDELCTVTAVKTCVSLFGHQVISMQVKRPAGDLINVIDHFPEDKLELFSG